MTFGGSVRVLSAVVAVAALGLTGCATEPPPVSEKVQEYYEENVVNAKALPSPTPSKAVPVAGVLGKLQAAVTGTGPVTISVLGDSTGNGPEEWVDLWAKHLAKYGAVTLHQWDPEANGWEAEPFTYGGGPKTITIWNASQPGSNYTYHLDKMDKMQPEAPTFTILSLGHNVATKPADVGSVELLYAVDRRWGSTPAVVMLQNPAQGDRAAKTDSSVTALSAWAPKAGYPTINVNQAFKAKGALPALLQDDVHPNPAGQKIWVDTVIAALG